MAWEVTDALTDDELSHECARIRQDHLSSSTFVNSNVEAREAAEVTGNDARCTKLEASVTLTSPALRLSVARVGSLPRHRYAKYRYYEQQASDFSLADAFLSWLTDHLSRPYQHFATQ